MVLTELEYMIMISESGSLSEAGNKLHLSQSAVSRFLKNVEMREGVELFARTNKYLRITPAGILYIQKAKEILDIRNTYQNELSEMQSNRFSVNLSIGTQSVRAPILNPRIYSLYDNYFPEGKVRIVSDSRTPLLDMLEKREIDFAVLNNIDLPPQYETHTIGSDTFLLAADTKKELPCTKGDPYDIVDLRDIINESFFLLDKTQGMRVLADHMLQDNRIVLPHIDEINRHEVSLNLVSMGLGLCFTLESYLPRFHLMNPVKCYAIRQHLSPISYDLICMPKHLSPDVLKHSIELMKAALSNKVKI